MPRGGWTFLCMIPAARFWWSPNSPCWETAAKAGGPSWNRAAPPQQARILYESLLDCPAARQGFHPGLAAQFPGHGLGGSPWVQFMAPGWPWILEYPRKPGGCFPGLDFPGCQMGKEDTHWVTHWFWLKEPWRKLTIGRTGFLRVGFGLRPTGRFSGGPGAPGQLKEPRGEYRTKGTFFGGRPFLAHGSPKGEFSHLGWRAQ